MSSSKRRIVYWLCLGVYVIGVMSYLVGLGAFAPSSAQDGAVVYQTPMEETVSPEEPSQFLSEESASSSLPIFSMTEWGEILLGVGAMILSTVVLREIETDPSFLHDGY